MDKRYFKRELKPFYHDEFITGDRKSKLIFGSKVIFNNFHYSEIESVNCKFFEIAGSGVFQVCDYKKIIDDYTLIPSFKYTFNKLDEAIELIKYYLSNPKLRYEYSEIQRDHFLKNHTYEHRMNELLKIVFG
jgi:spore maturation protein CgeB